MNKPEISFALSSVNPDKWPQLYNQLIKACNGHSFEVIGIGPKFPNSQIENIKNFRYIRDFGCPSRCVQLASVVAEGKYFTWLADDCFIVPNSIGESIEFLDSKSKKDIINVLYSEGWNYTGNQHELPDYWTAWYHGSLRLRHINKNWKLAIFGLYNLEYFRELGGVDCRFEHINFNSHDFAFRVQMDGGIVYNSPNRSYILDHDGNENTPIRQAHYLNDLPLFQKIYDSETFDRNIKIDYDNWKTIPSVWPRKYA